MPRRTTEQLRRAKQKALAARKHHLKTKHGMTLEQYDGIKAFQGGYCPICLRANGRTKELAVDHDHYNECSHPHNESCADCWRGLLCGPCNGMLAHARDDPEFFRRAIGYLIGPPAQGWRLSLEPPF